MAAAGVVLAKTLTRVRIVTFIDQCLDVAGNDPKAGWAPVIQYPRTGGANQEWLVVRHGDATCPDAVMLVAAHSGRALDIGGPNGKGTALFAGNLQGENNRWRLLEQPDGRFAISTAWNITLVVDVAASGGAGAPAIIWTPNQPTPSQRYTDNQLYRLETV